jgi:hypothetical protein
MNKVISPNHEVGDPACHGRDSGALSPDRSVHDLDGAEQSGLLLHRECRFEQQVTYYAQERGPMQAEKNRLKMKVMATKAMPWE